VGPRVGLDWWKISFPPGFFFVYHLLSVLNMLEGSYSPFYYKLIGRVYGLVWPLVCLLG